MELQIKQDWGRGMIGYLYFTVPNDTEEAQIKAKAIEVALADWDRSKGSQFNLIPPTPCRPTIHIRQFNSVTGSKVKGGLHLTTKWR